MPGLFNKKDFRDNCGFGLVANTNGIKSHKVITTSVDALISMTHRGGVGSDGKTGDGCGLLFDIDHNYFKNKILQEQKVDLDDHFAIGQLFFTKKLKSITSELEEILNKESLTLVATREVPIKKDILGKIALDCLPNIYQIFIKPKSKDFNHQEFETKLLQARKFIEEIFMDDETLYICSMSSKTIVYK